MGDASTAMHRELLLAFRNVDPAKAGPFIIELARRYDGKDRFYLAALGIAVGTDPKRREVILADFDKHFPEWNEQVADLVWELRPPSVMARLETMLADVRLPAGQRVHIVDILATGPGLDGGAKLLARPADEPSPAVRDRIIANFKQFLPGRWRGLGLVPISTRSSTNCWPNRRRRRRASCSSPVRRGAKRFRRFVALLSDPAGQAVIQLEAVKTLGELRSEPAVALLQTLVQQSDLLAIRVAAAEALGQHIAFGQRGGGPGRGGNPGRQAALETLQAIVLSKDGPRAIPRAAGRRIRPGRQSSRYDLADRRPNDQDAAR